MTQAPGGRERAYDAVVVGGGHNGLVAACYLARAGRSVLVLERLAEVGGASVSHRVFAGVDARLSRYSYLVSLLPRSVVADLGLAFRTAPRRISSYTPVPGTSQGLLVDTGDPGRTRAGMARVTGDPGVFDAWQGFYARTAALAAAVAPTLTEPLPSRAELRARLRDDATWDAFVERPLGEVVEGTFADAERHDLVRGVVLTDALIGTLASSADIRANRCFLYHVVGDGTGDWNVPVGGMGALPAELARVARDAGADLVTGAEVVGIDVDGRPGRARVRWSDGVAEHAATCEDVLAGCAPAVLDRLVGAPVTGSGAPPEGAQLKVNLLLGRLPRLRDGGVDPREAFGGTFHVNEGYAQLERAAEQAAEGVVPPGAPCETYCHTLTDPSILGPGLRAAGAQTLTVFGLHMPARLFRGDETARRARTAQALEATLRSLDSVLAEPIEDCLLRTPDGEPCIEVRTPLDLEDELALPAGHIFHRDLAWPFAEDEADVGRWGTETALPQVQLCGAGARRGGGVSGIPGHNAAMAVLRGR